MISWPWKDLILGDYKACELTDIAEKVFVIGLYCYLSFNYTGNASNQATNQYPISISSSFLLPWNKMRWMTFLIKKCLCSYFFFYIPWSQNFYCFPRAIDVLFQKNLPKLSWLVHVSCKINLWKKENHLLLGGFLFLNIPFINKCVRFLGDNTGPTAFLWENILWHYIKFLEPSPHDFWDCKKKANEKKLTFIYHRILFLHEKKME